MINIDNSFEIDVSDIAATNPETGAALRGKCRTLMLPPKPGEPFLLMEYLDTNDKLIARIDTYRHHSTLTLKPDHSKIRKMAYGSYIQSDNKTLLADEVADAATDASFDADATKEMVPLPPQPKTIALLRKVMPVDMERIGKAILFTQDNPDEMIALVSKLVEAGGPQSGRTGR